MTEIEKMFENAGIEPVDYKLESMGTLKFSVDDIGNTWTREQYMKEVPIYPPFTAEKQLKIVEWFISYSWWLNLKSLDIKLDFSLDFDEKLAKLVNRLWESFDDQEKEEIRKILNDN